MRIGIDGHVLGKNIGGVERFVREIVQNLPAEASQHEYVVFITAQEYAKLNTSFNELPRNLKYYPLAFSNPLIERLFLLPWLVYRHQLDALIVQRLAPWFCGQCKLIATIHDLTPIKFASAYKGLSNSLVRLLTKNTVKRANLILTPTNTIKEEIRAYCPEIKCPVAAFYNGVDISQFQQHQHLPKTKNAYILTVGAIERRKNIETILHALKLSSEPVKLVIVGGVRDKAYRALLQGLVIELGLQERVEFRGFTEENELVNLYQHAKAFISASKDEGFNIPPLEAMACGTPVICSDIPVHRELFDNAATFFDVVSPIDLAQKIDAVLSDPNQSKAQIKAGHSKVSLYNWRQTAKNVSTALALME